MSVVARIDMDIRSEAGTAQDPRLEQLDCYALGSADLSRYAGLVFPATVDQEYLAGIRHVVRRYLDGGGVVVFGGHLLRDWLPGASAFVPLARPGLAAYRVERVAEHPVFAGVDPDDLTFRRGVAGFFARGHHPLPPGAEVLTELAGGLPATYVDRVSTAGTILVHTSADLLGYGASGDGTATRIPGQLLDWVVAESTRRRAALPGRAGGGLAAVYGGSAAHHRALTEPKYARHLTGGLLPLPALADTDLTRFDAVIVPERLHRGLLTAAAPRFRDLLDAGGTVLAFSGGEPVPEFLPGVEWEHRPTNYWWWLERGADLGLRSPHPDHGLFDHLGLRDCTWHYHGVLHPPAGAQVLVELRPGEALLYVDEVTTPGRLVVATLDPWSHFGSHFMPATERFLDGFLPWASGLTRTAVVPAPAGR
ncbi:MAG TPA: hypothetical protein VM367_08225 [Pseudonocardia sp.]|nr:hypothetical protein [Pseudonocardia sp.]